MDLDQLRASTERRLARAACRGVVTEEDVTAVLLDACEYAAAQVEAHARPGPWPPRKPSPLTAPAGRAPEAEGGGMTFRRLLLLAALFALGIAAGYRRARSREQEPYETCRRRR